MGAKLISTYFFLETEMLLIDLAHENVQKSKKNFLTYLDISYQHHHILAFSAGNLAFTCFVKLQILVLLLSLFFKFRELEFFSIRTPLP